MKEWTLNKPTETVKVNFCTRHRPPGNVHFTIKCISAADVYYLVIIVVCVLLEPAILISKLLLRIPYSTYVASFVWSSTKTEWNAKNTVWTFYHT